MAAVGPCFQNAFHPIHAGVGAIYNFSPEERYEAANQYFSQGFYADAMQLYQNYPANGPNYLASFVQAARCLFLLGECDNALRHFQQINHQICKGLNFPSNYTGLRGSNFSCEREGNAVDMMFVSVSSNVIHHLIYFGDAYAKLGFYNEAHTKYAKALWVSHKKQLEDMSAISGILIAKMLIKLNRQEEAKVYFLGAVDYYKCDTEPFPDNDQKIQFLDAYGWCASKLQQPEDLGPLYREAPIDHPNAIYHLRKLALTQRDRDQMERVLELARRFFLHHPYIGKIHSDLEHMYSELTEGEQKREHYGRALAEWKHQIVHSHGIDKSLSYYQLGKLEKNFGKNLEAFRCFENALAHQSEPLNPIHKKIRNAWKNLKSEVNSHLSEIDERRGRDGVESLNKLIELLCRHLESVDIAFDRLSAIIEQEDFHKHSLEIQARCLRNLGCIRSNQENHVEATLYFLRAKELYKPCTPIHRYDILYRLASSLARQNCHIEAIEYYAQAIEMRPNAKNPGFSWTDRPPEDALERLTRSLELVQGDPPAPASADQMRRAAENLFSKCHYSQTIACFNMALKWSDENRCEIWIRLGSCYRLQEDFFRALNYFNSVLNEGSANQREEAKGLAIGTLNSLRLTEQEQGEDVPKIWVLSDIMIHLDAFNRTPELPHYLAQKVCENLIQIGLTQDQLPRSAQSLNQALKMGTNHLLMQEIVYNPHLSSLVWASGNDPLKASLERAQKDREQFMLSGQAYVAELRKHMNLLE